ncbi:MAG: chorismate synthase [Chloroflexi bacterium RBG_16_68_14]|nr:MAG: chorismate synthase [Chloroflexi bacterium RBG_16_68_14]
MPTLRFLTAGESHGKGLTVIIEGVPAGLPLTEEYIARDLRRRQGGYGRGRRQKIEQDRAEIRSGVRHGRTIGSPIALLIENKDWANWQEVMALEEPETPVEKVTRLRPGHADLPGVIKYGFDDVRPVLERASARETAARVAVGAVARRFLEEFGVAVHSYTITIDGVEAQVEGEPDWERVEASPVRCADPEAEQRMIAAIDQARNDGDSLGGIVEVRASGVPIGLGSHVHWDRKIDGRIAQAIMSINAIKGVEIGIGFAGARLRGSQVQDVILPIDRWGERPWRRATNRLGGTEGGMTNGEEVVVRAALKPIATLPRSLPSADLHTGEEIPAHYERSDVCVVPAAGVIGEAVLATVLAEACLEKFGGDHLEETLRNYRAYQKTTGPRGGTAVPPVEEETTEV